MVNAEQLQAVRYAIANMASTEEEVQAILQSLLKTNWSVFFINGQSPIRCGWCQACLIPPPANTEDDFCLACKEHLCALCKQPALEPYHGRYYTVICPACLIRRNLDNEWHHNESRKIIGQEMRAVHAGRIGDLSYREWLTTLEDFNWLCAYCQKHPYEVLEHFIPITKGGDTITSNCVPACKDCNAAKSGKHPNKVKLIPREDIDRVRTYLNIRL